MASKKTHIIKKCIDIIRTYNPVTHSMDTHIFEKLGDVTKKDADPGDVFIQQVCYGWLKEKAVLDHFISNFYADNAACVLRTDMIMYAIFAYLALYRLEELGFQRFKEFTMTQDPTKIYNFASYLFNKDNLWSSLRSDWMKVRDLSYVEDDLIAGIENFAPELSRFCSELEEKAVGLAAAQTAKEEAKKAGTVGIGKVNKKPPTIPKSPRLNPTRLPQLPEPERIMNNIVANEVPGFINKTNLAEIQRQREAERERQRELIKQKYGEHHEFKFNYTKGGRDLEDVRQEIEEERMKEVRFDSAFVHEPPDFSKIPAKVRVNASTIYREDALFRKQQAKDAEILKQYEHELRDQTEFLLWQREMRQKDEKIKVEHVVFRREQAKLSSEEAREAVIKQKEDNKTMADLLRQQADAIKEQTAIEREIEVLKKQALAQSVAEARDSKPIEAKIALLEDRGAMAQKLRDQLEAARIAKEKEDQLEEERKADIIRQLRAENTVHKKQVKVFDPTEVAGIGLLDEMSYMEMKERLNTEKARAEREEVDRRQRILDEKEKKAKDLESRAMALMKARQIKAESNKIHIVKRKEAEIQAEQEKERAREVAAFKLEQDLREKREEKRRQAAALKAEEDRVRRQQQYLGAAAGLVEETREEQLLRGQERELKASQHRAKTAANLYEEAKNNDVANRVHLRRQQKSSKDALDIELEKIVLEDRRRAVEKMKEVVVYKKTMVKGGKAQHEITRNVTVQHNQYAATISEESVAQARFARTRSTSAQHTLHSSVQFA